MTAPKVGAMTDVERAERAILAYGEGIARGVRIYALRHVARRRRIPPHLARVQRFTAPV